VPVVSFFKNGTVRKALMSAKLITTKQLWLVKQHFVYLLLQHGSTVLLLISAIKCFLRCVVQATVQKAITWGKIIVAMSLKFFWTS